MMRLLILATMLLAACSGGGSGATDVSDDRFIDAIVELRRAAVENPGGFASAKAQILAEHSVTEESLRAYIYAHLDDLGRLAAAWDTINARLGPAEEPIE